MLDIVIVNHNSTDALMLCLRSIYDSLGEHDRYWVSFLYLGGGISLPISKSVSLNAEVLWDLIQDQNSPYKSLQPFFNVGIGIGF